MTKIDYVSVSQDNGPGCPYVVIYVHRRDNHHEYWGYSYQPASLRIRRLDRGLAMLRKLAVETLCQEAAGEREVYP